MKKDLTAKQGEMICKAATTFILLHISSIVATFQPASSLTDAVIAATISTSLLWATHEDLRRKFKRHAGSGEEY